MTLRTFEMAGHIVDCKPVNKESLEDAFNTHKIQYASFYVSITIHRTIWVRGNKCFKMMIFKYLNDKFILIKRELSCAWIFEINRFRVRFFFEKTSESIDSFDIQSCPILFSSVMIRPAENMI